MSVCTIACAATVDMMNCFCVVLLPTLQQQTARPSDGRMDMHHAISKWDEKRNDRYDFLSTATRARLCVCVRVCVSTCVCVCLNTEHCTPAVQPRAIVYVH